MHRYAVSGLITAYRRRREATINMETSEARKVLLIVNPVSGTRSKRGLETTVRQRLARAGAVVRTVMTEGPNHASALASEAVRDGIDCVIAAGGDGTVNEIATALSHTRTALGVIPLGSGNGLARTLGIPQDVNAALDIICAGNMLRTDRGMVNGRPFYCTFGVGFDAAVSEKFAAEKRRGRVTYVRNVIREFLHYSPECYTISFNGKIFTKRAFLIAVANASQYGNNAYIAPHDKMTDGFLDLIVVHDGPPISTVKVGVDLLAGNIDRNARIDTFRVQSAVISRIGGGSVHVDGEPLTMGETLSIHCDEGALHILAPEQMETFKPIVSPLRALIADARYDLRAILNR